MNPILLDVLAAAVLLFFLWRGYRKGFVLTLCGFLAVFVALAGSTILSNVLAEPVARMVEPVIETRIQEALTEAIQNAELPAMDGTIAQLPEELPLAAVVEQLKESKLYQGFADAFLNAVDSGVASITANAAHSLAHFVAVQITRTAVCSISFLAILIAWNVLSRALNLVAKLPVLNSINRWGGGAVGLCKGLVIVFIASWLFQSSYLPVSTVEQTHLLRLLCTLNPFYGALGG